MDNASNNITKTVCQSAYINVRCLAHHAINLTVKKGLAVCGAENIIAKLCKVVAHFHKSPKPSSCFKERQTLANFLKDHKLIIDVQTCWNSPYDMLERFLEQFLAIHLALLELRTTELLQYMAVEKLQTNIEALCSVSSVSYTII